MIFNNHVLRKISVVEKFIVVHTDSFIISVKFSVKK